MNKVKINLINGTSVEKNVLTAFKNGLGSYVVFDNESLGSMGLPIILISKIVDNQVVKIVDQNEWNTVKDCLRQIIAGNQMEYVSVNPEVTGEEVFYVQLTLPVASFDVLKNCYKPVDAVNEVVEPAASLEPVVETPVENITSPTKAAPEVVLEPTPSVEVPVINESPVEVNASQNIESPVEPVVETPITPTESINTPNQKVNEAVITEPVIEEPKTDFTADKEAFLKACENMFDALIAKFNK
ncbi:MAG: hypothetical protein E7172_02745 [Firmicutes bacterium]|nr:hypothetical protein [Bacillota bacterium]